VYFFNTLLQMVDRHADFDNSDAACRLRKDGDRDNDGQ